MNSLETFNAYRALLMSISYRMLGTRADAEDVVQETFLRWQSASREEIGSPRSFLATIVTRLCIDQLRSARAQREVYVGPWLPEPILTPPGADSFDSVELAESLTMAFLVLLESLSPTERAAFLMHEVFEYDYAEIAHTVGKSEASCRQIIHRAKERVAARNQRFETSKEETERITSQFLEATSSGNVSELMNLIADDAVLMSDGGGKVRAAGRPIHGADPIARFILGVTKKGLSANAIHTPAKVNGQNALLTSVDGHLISATVLDIRGGRIQNIFVVLNPDKLGSLSASA